MNLLIPNLKKTSNHSQTVAYQNHFLSLYRLVNEIDEFENDDALTSNAISVTSFRSAGE